ncbi:metal ABC transporter permease [Pectinatus cerevisiiphilus]|uniref:Zinc transport system permease protein n=1 Tax=Pectinatus cerevisiiphilus TaxID=86956 RepID=A0A4R3K9F2_9FIRM|nr:metal ABC transporter permease [Pectinatus cerevisiiphilus]TCS79656.1 zinc transport system permease protein [Pectinatus cerevisiiphilus]
MFTYNFMQNAFLISIFIAALCPVIGMFLVLRRYSMMGDTLSHASLAGIAVGMLFNQNPVLSAFLMVSFFSIAIEWLRKHFRTYAELILVIILSLSIGIAITLLSSGLVHANIDSLMFGSVLTVTRTDFYWVLFFSIVSLFLVYKFYYALVFMVFDEEGAAIAGVNIKFINYLFAVIVAATISISIRIVGILVISSLIALPIAAALQLEVGFKKTLLYGVLFSYIDIFSGIIISYWINAAPGGIIAINAVLLLLCVLFYKHKIKHRGSVQNE